MGTVLAIIDMARRLTPRAGQTPRQALDEYAAAAELAAHESLDRYGLRDLQAEIRRMERRVGSSLHN